MGYGWRDGFSIRRRIVAKSDEMGVTLQESMKLPRFLSGLGMALLLTAGAWGQSFNVDYDLYNGHALTGAGAPSSSFGAASGQTGFWESLPNDFAGPYYLRDLHGVQTGVAVYATGLGGGGGWNNPNLSGDFKKLMADGEFISDGFELRLEGLANGRYDVFTYCMKPNDRYGDSTIIIPGARVPEQRAFGYMTNNVFLQGVTHTAHTDIVVNNGIMRIQGRAQGAQGFLNGFQITLVPEPSAILVFSTMFAGYIFFRRQAR